MGMDLVLFPYHYGDVFNWRDHLAADRIRLDRDYEIFAQIDSDVIGSGYAHPQVCNPENVPLNVRVTTYEDEGLRYEVREDAYGSRLTFVLAKELAKVNTEGASPWNKAVFAFVKALPDSVPIILWWC